MIDESFRVIMKEESLFPIAKLITYSSFKFQDKCYIEKHTVYGVYFPVLMFGFLSTYLTPFFSFCDFFKMIDDTLFEQMQNFVNTYKNPSTWTDNTKMLFKLSFDLT